MPGADLVDWGLAERVAVRLASRAPAPAPAALAALRDDVSALTPLAERLVTETTGLRPPSSAEVHLVDRRDWVRANLVSFRGLLTPLLDRWSEQASTSARLRGMTARVSAVELGSLLGWMSGRVLGQYDLLVAGGPDEAGAPPDGAVYLVAPNLLVLEERFGFPPSEFRLWVTLHELTHRAQFEGVPWLRPHFLGLVQDALRLAEPDLARLGEAARTMVTDRQEVRRRLDEGGLAAVLAAPEQRRALNEIGGMMALLEGHGDVVMDRAGAGHIPTAGRFGHVLQARRRTANPFARALRRLIGLEAKLAQYHLGERFIAHVESAAGEQVIDRVWEAPAHLPSLDEIRTPDLWLERMGLARALA